jgi:hypothetical protein
VAAPRVRVNLVLAVPKGRGEDKHNEEDCADPDAGIPDLCRMCDDR